MNIFLKIRTLPGLKLMLAIFRKLGSFITSIINFVLLLVVYLIGVGLTAIIAKVVGKHFLDLSFKGKTKWMDKKSIKGEEQYYRMF